MVTASHLPFNRNGFKFCTDKGGLEKADIADLLSRAAQAAADEGVRAVPEPYADAGRVMAACLHTEPSLIASVRLTAQKHRLCVCFVCRMSLLYVVYIAVFLSKQTRNPSRCIGSFFTTVFPGCVTTYSQAHYHTQLAN